MFGLGFSEILVLGVIALIFLGPEQLPELARTVGRFVNDLKRSTESITEDLKSQVRIDLDEKRRELSVETVRDSDLNPQIHVPDSGQEEKKEEQMDLFSEENMNRAQASVEIKKENDGDAQASLNNGASGPTTESKLKE